MAELRKVMCVEDDADIRDLGGLLALGDRIWR